MNKFTKRALIVLGTVIGVVALFLIIVFIPVGNSNTAEPVKNENVASESAETDTDGMSKKELEKRVKELEDENAQLKDDVERYKILAEQTTKAVSAPKVTPPKTDSKDGEDKKDKDDNDTSSDKKPSSIDKPSKDDTNSSAQKPSTGSSSDKPSSGNSSSGDSSSGNSNSSNTSDTGL